MQERQEPIQYPRWVSADAWGDRSRSALLSPLYINRYAGRRANQPGLTAHDYWELTFAFGGHGELCFEHRTFTMDGCAALLIPAGMLHQERTAHSRWDTLWIGLAGDWFHDVPSEPILLSDATELAPLAELLWDWQQRQLGQCGPELDALALFLLRAFRRLASRAGQRSQAWLPRVLSHIGAHLADPLQVSDLADLAGCSTGHFQRRFRAETGQTPWQFILDKRLELALVYLRESNDPIKSIARRAGFRDPLYFSRIFRQRYGCAPSELRGER